MRDKFYELQIDIKNKEIKSNFREDSWNDNYQFLEKNDMCILLDGKLLIDGQNNTVNDIYILVRKAKEIDKLFKELNTRISGDFCLIIFDKQYMYLLRDPLGHKVCYYLMKNNIIFISNKIKEVYKKLNSKELDLDYATQYLIFQTPGYMEDYLTPIKDIRRVEAGKCLKINEHRIESQYYYDVNKIEVYKNISENEVVKIFEDSIERSFEENLCYCTNNIAVLISGGLDSTILCEFLNRKNMNVKYFNYVLSDDEIGYSEENYLGILREKYDINIERIVLPELRDSLFRSILENSEYVGEEPGTLRTEPNTQVIIRKLIENNCNSMMIGYVESLFRFIYSDQIKSKEYEELKLNGKLKYFNFYKTARKDKKLKNTTNYMNDKVNLFLENTKSEDLILSNSLYERYKEKDINKEDKPISLNELKYKEVLSPNLECLGNFRYERDGLETISPLHNTNLLKAILSTHSYMYQNDRKYFLKKIDGIPKEIIERPKISCSTTRIIKEATKVASILINKELKIKSVINEKRFKEMCLKIMLGNFTPQEFRQFRAIVSLEKFVENYQIKIEL